MDKGIFLQQILYIIQLHILTILHGNSVVYRIVPHQIGFLGFVIGPERHIFRDFFPEITLSQAVAENNQHQHRKKDISQRTSLRKQLMQNWEQHSHREKGIKHLITQLFKIIKTSVDSASPAIVLFHAAVQFVHIGTVQIRVVHLHIFNRHSGVQKFPGMAFDHFTFIGKFSHKKIQHQCGQHPQHHSGNQDFGGSPLLQRTQHHCGNIDTDITYGNAAQLLHNSDHDKSGSQQMDLFKQA